MRTKPPGITRQPSPTLARNSRSVNGRGCRRPSRQTGMLDSVTASWATIIEAAVADRLDQRVALRVVELGAEDFAAEARIGELLGESRRDHHAVELSDHLLAHVGAAEPPGRDIRHFQFGAEHDRRQRRQESQHGARLDQAGAERIDDDDLAVAHGLHQPGDAEPRGGVEFERIGEIGVDAAQQHFGAPQSRDGADEDAVVLVR